MKHPMKHLGSGRAPEACSNGSLPDARVATIRIQVLDIQVLECQVDMEFQVLADIYLLTVTY